MLRRNLITLFASEYVPKAVPGRDWSASSASTSRGSNTQRISAEKLLQHQNQAFFNNNKSTTTTKDLFFLEAPFSVTQANFVGFPCCQQKGKKQTKTRNTTQ